jgi:Flp pilus assembly protein TadD
LNSSIEEAGHRRSLRRPTADLTAFEHLARGRTLFRSYSPGVNERAKAHFAAAIAADPSMGIAHSFHALADAALHDYSLAPPEAKARFRAEGFLAVDLSPEESRCHGILSLFHAWTGEFELAELAARRAVDLNPSDADALYDMAVINLTRGRPQDCLDWMHRAKDVNPVWPAFYDVEHSFVLFYLGEFAEAARLLSCVPRRSARQEMRLAATYAMAGELALARRHVAAARALDPAADFVRLASVGYAFEHARDRKVLVEAIELALSIAALPEAGGATAGGSS